MLWWNDILLGLSAEDKWHKNFRMSRETFDFRQNYYAALEVLNNLPGSRESCEHWQNRRYIVTDSCEKKSIEVHKFISFCYYVLPSLNKVLN